MRLLVLTLWCAVAILGYVVATKAFTRRSLEEQIAAQQADVRLKRTHHHERQQQLQRVENAKRAQALAQVVDSQEAALFRKVWSDPTYVKSRAQVVEHTVYHDYEAFLTRLPLSAAEKKTLVTLLTERRGLAQYQERHSRLNGGPSEEHALRLAQVEARIAETLESVGAPSLRAYEASIPERNKVAFFEQHLRNCETPLTTQQVETLVAAWHTSAPGTNEFSMPAEVFQKLIEDDSLSATQVNELVAMQQLRLAMQDMAGMRTKQ